MAARCYLLAGLATLLLVIGSASTQAQDTAAHDGPTYGTFGLDEAGMDRSVPPGDNFFLYGDGNWLKNTEIPADKARYGIFNVLNDLSEARTRSILEGATNTNINTAYTTYLDTAAIEARGLAPARPWMDRIESVTPAGYATLIGELANAGVQGPFGAGVGQDDKNPDAYIVELGQAGLGMPDREYYLSDKPQLVKAREAYLKHLTTMLTLAGITNAAPRAQAIMDFETAIAKVSWARADRRDADKTYNKMTLTALQSAAPGFDFAAYYKAQALEGTDVIVREPSAVTGIAKEIAATPIEVLRDQALVRLLDGYADVLPKAFDDEHFAYYGTVLSGIPQQRDRWKRAVSFTSGALDDDVSKLYVAKYFPPATKAAALELVHNIIAAMNARIDKLTWMSAETKVKAHQKLANFTPKIGYPDRWKDLSGIKIVAGDAWGNKWRAATWRSAYEANKLGKPIYRWEWGMTPMTINAYANPPMVEIVFPAAILQPPFFDPKADPAINYGGIGAVIGHEMSHHFDDQGAKFDAHGRLAQWWTPADVAAFKARTDALAKEYDAYEPVPGTHINGRLTLGENTADLAGLTVAYDAYKRSLHGKPAPVLDGLTGDQRFYLGWAQVWREKDRPADALNRLLTDPHSPAEQRVWTVRNLDNWYAAFHPKPTDKMYLPPSERVRIW